MLDDFDERRDPELPATRSPTTLRQQLAGEIRDGHGRRLRRRRRSTASGTAGGFKIMIEDRGDIGLDGAAGGGRRDRRRRATSTPGLRGLFTSFRANTPLAVPGHRPRPVPRRWACRSATSSTRCRSTSARCYVNDFNRFGRTWQVNVQADAALPQPASRTCKQLQGPQRRRARWCRWARWPTSREVNGPVMLDALQHVPRRRRSTATPRPGVSSGQAIDADGAAGRATSCRRSMALRVDRADLPAAAGRQHGHARLRAGGGAGVPGAGGAVRELVAAAGGDPGRADVPALLDRRRADWPSMDINIFTQIGFVVLVGLASKNAILIVEFAKQQREAGVPPPRGDAGGVPAAAAADHDDVVRVHPRRGAAGARRRAPARRCGGRWARRCSAACSA